MTGREKIESAFSREGTPEIPVVICYEGIYVRDHWSQLTDCPWWYSHMPDLERQMRWHREVIASIGQDWFTLPYFHSREARQHLSVEERADGVYRRDARTGAEVQLQEPQVAGWSPSGGLHSVHREYLAQTPEELDVWIPLPGDFNAAEFQATGVQDLAARLLAEFGGQLYPICHVSSPLWGCYGLWGFEGLMTLIAERPDVVAYAGERFLAQTCHAVKQAAALGAAGIWIEECMTDMIGPRAFEKLNLPFMRRLIETIRDAGMHSIYYFCGDPSGKWDLLLDTGADALSLEESKKGFVIDIEEAAERVQGRCVLLGNLDAIGVLQDGSESELRAEIARQIAAGRRNGGRFVMSAGSPVTPGTSPERVRRYCDLVREMQR